MDTKFGKPPYTVVLIDTWDAWIDADIFDEDRYHVIGGEGDFDSLNKAIILADSLYMIKNYLWDSFEEMQNNNGGWDARIYDKDFHCIYKAYKSFQKSWISPWREKIWVDNYQRINQTES